MNTKQTTGGQAVRSNRLLALPFRVIEAPFPGRGKWIEIFHGGTSIGCAEVLPDGYKVVGKRKVMPTIVLAAKQMIDGNINAARAAEQKAASMLNDLRRVAGPLTANIGRTGPAASDGTVPPVVRD